MLRHLFLLWTLPFLYSCTTSESRDHLSHYKKGTLTLSSGKSIKTFIADTEKKQALGLSGVKSLNDDESMLFLYDKMNYLSFWMPDTYLNLDIFFLTKDLTVFYIERNVPAHPGRSEPPTIYRTARVFAAAVLELKSESPLSQEIKKGDKLIYK